MVSSGKQYGAKCAQWFITHQLLRMLLTIICAKSVHIGCGKARAVIELLFQHWGFYFNAADDDWGSGDIKIFDNTVRSYLKDVQANSAEVDLEINKSLHG